MNADLAAEERARAARRLSAMTAALLVGLLPVLAHNAYSRNWTMVAVVGAAWVCLLAPLALVRRGPVELAGLLFTGVVLFFIAAVVALSSLGVYDVSTIAFPSLIVAAGLVLEKKSSFTAAAAAVVAVVTALYVATLAGLLHNPVGDRFSVGVLIDVNVILLVTAVAIRLLRRQYAESARSARRSALEARALLESSPEAIARLDLTGTVADANARAASLLGLAAGELRGRAVPELVAAADRERALQALERVRAGATVRDLRLDLLHAGGRVVPTETSAAPIRDQEGVVEGMVVQSRDISRRLRDEERLQELQRQFLQSQKLESIGRLAGGVAHDLNNYLTAIVGFAELARLNPGDAAAVEADLGRLLQAADRARSVAGQLLAFARQRPIQPQTVSLNDLVEGFTALVRPLIGEQIELLVRLSPEAGHVHADPVQLEQVLVNLLVNARDAMPQGGTLRVETGRRHLGPEETRRLPELAPGEYAAVSVVDTGAGMGPEVTRHLFEPFFTTKPVGKGSGLGLATCLGIVRQAGGALEVESAPGRGTAVSVLLPPAAQSAAPAAAGRPPSAARGGETILFVEDEDFVRAAALEGLRRFGYTLLEAWNADEALRAVDRHAGRIDLLVTDIVMPGMNGRRLAEALLARRPGLPVLFASGYADEGGLPEEVREDRLRFIAKPYTPTQLAARVREVLDRRRGLTGGGCAATVVGGKGE